MGKNQQLAWLGIGIYTGIMKRKSSRIKEQFVVDGEGRRKAVILPMEEYEELIEDLHDLAVVAERQNEETLPMEEIKKRLKSRGLV